MLPISEVYKRIPKDALESFKKTFDPSQYDKILQAIRVKRKTTFRVNTLKCSKNEVTETLRRDGFKFKQINFLADSYILDEEASNKLLKTTLAADGKIYLQSTSSMIPPAVLAPKPNENILDMAAAPGSKTSQMAALMNNTGSITALEVDKLRIQRLEYNLNLLGVTNVKCICADGTRFSTDETFHRVLIDAPCSGEGRFNLYDTASYGLWRPNTVLSLAKLQKKLLAKGASLLAPGGTAIYSTCTLNVYENEMVVQSLLDSRDDIKIAPVDEVFVNLNNTIAGFSSYEGVTFDKNMKNCLRVLPTNEMEGFFVCKLVKK